MIALEIIDSTLLAWAYDWRHPALNAVMGMLTWLGSLAVLLPLALACAWQTRPGAQLSQRAFIPAAVLGSASIAHLLKWLIDRERPELFPSLIAMPADSSFPSAHAFQISAFVAAWLATTGGWRHAGQLVCGIVLVLLVGLSRIYLQVHFPSDVAFGIVGGLLWVVLLLRLPHRWSV